MFRILFDINLFWWKPIGLGKWICSWQNIFHLLIAIYVSSSSQHWLFRIFIPPSTMGTWALHCAVPHQSLRIISVVSIQLNSILYDKKHNLCLQHAHTRSSNGSEGPSEKVTSDLYYLWIWSWKFYTRKVRKFTTKLPLPIRCKIITLQGWYKTPSVKLKTWFKIIHSLLRYKRSPKQSFSCSSGFFYTQPKTLHERRSRRSQQISWYQVCFSGSISYIYIIRDGHADAAMSVDAHMRLCRMRVGWNIWWRHEGNLFSTL